MNMKKILSKLLIVFMITTMGVNVVTSVGCSNSKKSKASAKKKKKKTKKKKVKREVKFSGMQKEFLDDFTSDLSSSSKKTRLRACDKLGEMYHLAQTSIPQLRKVEKSDKSSSVRKAATNAIKKIKSRIYEWK